MSFTEGDIVNDTHYDVWCRVRSNYRHPLYDTVVPLEVIHGTPWWGEGAWINDFEPRLRHGEPTPWRLKYRDFAPGEIDAIVDYGSYRFDALEKGTPP